MTDPIADDKAHCWHPFTPQDVWRDPPHEPLLIVRTEVGCPIANRAAANFSIL